MNSLNSVLFEGILTDEPVEIRDSDDTFSYHLTVRSERRYFKENEWNIDKTDMGIIVDNDLFNGCRNDLTIGIGIRVVGRLNGSNTGDNEGLKRIIIQAEHIDYKTLVSVAVEDSLKDKNYYRSI